MQRGWLFGWSSIETTHSRHGQPASGLSQKQSGVHPWRQSRQEAASPSGGMADGDSTKVVYKIRQWSLPGATVVPCSMLAAEFSGLNWRTKLSWTAILCYRKASCAMFFHRNALLHGQGAPGQRLTVAIMLPGRQDADDWLNFMLSQKNLWPTFTTRGSLTDEISEQTFRKERRRLHTGQASLDGGQAALERFG